MWLFSDIKKAVWSAAKTSFDAISDLWKTVSENKVVSSIDKAATDIIKTWAKQIVKVWDVVQSDALKNAPSVFTKNLKKTVSEWKVWELFSKSLKQSWIEVWDIASSFIQGWIDVAKTIPDTAALYFSAQEKNPFNLLSYTPAKSIISDSFINVSNSLNKLSDFIGESKSQSQKEFDKKEFEYSDIFDPKFISGDLSRAVPTLMSYAIWGTWVKNLIWKIFSWAGKLTTSLLWAGITKTAESLQNSSDTFIDIYNRTGNKDEAIKSAENVFKDSFSTIASEPVQFALDFYSGGKWGMLTKWLKMWASSLLEIPEEIVQSKSQLDEVRKTQWLPELTYIEYINSPEWKRTIAISWALGWLWNISSTYISNAWEAAWLVWDTIELEKAKEILPEVEKKVYEEAFKKWKEKNVQDTSSQQENINTIAQEVVSIPTVSKAESNTINSRLDTTSTQSYVDTAIKELKTVLPTATISVVDSKSSDSKYIKISDWDAQYQIRVSDHPLKGKYEQAFWTPNQEIDISSKQKLDVSAVQRWIAWEKAKPIRSKFETSDTFKVLKDNVDKMSDAEVASFANQFVGPNVQDFINQEFEKRWISPEQQIQIQDSAPPVQEVVKKYEANWVSEFVNWWIMDNSEKSFFDSDVKRIKWIDIFNNIWSDSMNFIKSIFDKYWLNLNINVSNIDYYRNYVINMLEKVENNIRLVDIYSNFIEDIKSVISWELDIDELNSSIKSVLPFSKRITWDNLLDRLYFYQDMIDRHNDYINKANKSYVPWENVEWFYNPSEQMIMLFNTVSDATFIHEFAHHLEWYLTNSDQKKLSDLYIKERSKRKKEISDRLPNMSSENIDKYLDWYNFYSEELSLVDNLMNAEDMRDINRRTIEIDKINKKIQDIKDVQKDFDSLWYSDIYRYRNKNEFFAEEFKDWVFRRVKKEWIVQKIVEFLLDIIDWRRRFIKNTINWFKNGQYSKRNSFYEWIFESRKPKLTTDNSPELTVEFWKKEEVKTTPISLYTKYDFDRKEIKKTALWTAWGKISVAALWVWVGSIFTGPLWVAVWAGIAATSVSSWLQKFFNAFSYLNQFILPNGKKAGNFIASKSNEKVQATNQLIDTFWGYAEMDKALWWTEYADSIIANIESIMPKDLVDLETGKEMTDSKKDEMITRYKTVRWMLLVWAKWFRNTNDVVANENYSVISDAFTRFPSELNTFLNEKFWITAESLLWTKFKDKQNELVASIKPSLVESKVWIKFADDYERAVHSGPLSAYILGWNEANLKAEINKKLYEWVQKDTLESTANAISTLTKSQKQWVDHLRWKSPLAEMVSYSESVVDILKNVEIAHIYNSLWVITNQFNTEYSFNGMLNQLMWITDKTKETYNYWWKFWLNKLMKIQKSLWQWSSVRKATAMEYIGWVGKSLSDLFIGWTVFTLAWIKGIPQAIYFGVPQAIPQILSSGDLLFSAKSVFSAITELTKWIVYDSETLNLLKKYNIIESNATRNIGTEKIAWALSAYSRTVFGNPVDNTLRYVLWLWEINRIVKENKKDFKWSIKEMLVEFDGIINNSSTSHRDILLSRIFEVSSTIMTPYWVNWNRFAFYNNPLWWRLKHFTFTQMWKRIDEVDAALTTARDMLKWAGKESLKENRNELLSLSGTALRYTTLALIASGIVKWLFWDDEENENEKWYKDYSRLMMMSQMLWSLPNDEVIQPVFWLAETIMTVPTRMLVNVANLYEAHKTWNDLMKRKYQEELLNSIKIIKDYRTFVQSTDDIIGTLSINWNYQWLESPDFLSYAFRTDTTRLKKNILQEFVDKVTSWEELNSWVLKKLLNSSIKYVSDYDWKLIDPFRDLRDIAMNSSERRKFIDKWTDENAMVQIQHELDNIPEWATFAEWIQSLIPKYYESSKRWSVAISVGKVVESYSSFFKEMEWYIQKDLDTTFDISWSNGKETLNRMRKEAPELYAKFVSSVYNMRTKIANDGPDAPIKASDSFRRWDVSAAAVDAVSFYTQTNELANAFSDIVTWKFKELFWQTWKLTTASFSEKIKWLSWINTLMWILEWMPNILSSKVLKSIQWQVWNEFVQNNLYWTIVKNNPELLSSDEYAPLRNSLEVMADIYSYNGQDWKIPSPSYTRSLSSWKGSSRGTSWGWKKSSVPLDFDINRIESIIAKLNPQWVNSNIVPLWTPDTQNLQKRLSDISKKLSKKGQWSIIQPETTQKNIDDEFVKLTTLLGKLQRKVR